MGSRTQEQDVAQGRLNRVGPLEDMPNEAHGWLERVGLLEDVLNEAHGVVAEIVGPIVVSEGAKEAGAADCEAQRLSWSLERAIGSADQLLGRLKKVRKQF